MSVSKRVRFEVFKRDRFTCQYCGKRPPDVMLEADHVVPRCEGGVDAIENLTTACAACNRGKSGVPLGNVAPAIDEMTLLEGIQAMLERAAAMRQSAAVAEARRQAEDEAVGVIERWWEETLGDPRQLQDVSLRRFLRDLSMEEVNEAIEATARKSQHAPWDGSSYKAWKYFCGVCWSMIKERVDPESP